jgi:uncharacterized SAM-binding protein YcdF (DUF218 family)
MESSRMKKLILHLGGDTRRADKCIELANLYPDTPILVSSEGGDVLKYYTDRGIDPDRVFIDMLAWDTVTNFTATLKRVRREFKVRKVFVVTTDFHMERAMKIANAVYWMRGIRPVASPSGPPSHKEKYVRQDQIRAWIYRLTGVLFYWKSVREEREKSGIGYPKKWNEIGL